MASQSLRTSRDRLAIVTVVVAVVALALVIVVPPVAAPLALGIFVLSLVRLRSADVDRSLTWASLVISAVTLLITAVLALTLFAVSSSTTVEVVQVS